MSARSRFPGVSPDPAGLRIFVPVTDISIAPGATVIGAEADRHVFQITVNKRSVCIIQIKMAHWGDVTRTDTIFMGMSALGQKRTCAAHKPMSAKGQKRTLCACYSMISSARASSEGGMVRPRAFAVFRFMMSSYLLGACTGRSAGFSPFNMRSM